MKNKQVERGLVREMRKSGESIKVIAKKIGVSVSSVSTWTRDIVLTDQQVILLKDRNPCFNRQIKGGETNKLKFREKRKAFQVIGRMDAKLGKPLHLIGCMLFWGEGSKQRNSVRLGNTDSNLIFTFVRFLRECFNVPNEKMRINVCCYDDKGLSVTQIENFWLDLLSLDRKSLGKTMLNYDSRGKQNPRKKHLYGCCTVIVNNTEIAQRIYGAIQEYCGFDKTEWLDIKSGVYLES